jgi:hypothetical protein
MVEYLNIFGIGFISVFALGFQSRNVNNGNVVWAAGTSFFIGISNAFLWSKITAESAGLIAGTVYGLSGACAITASMYIHKRFIENGRTSKPS